MDGNNKLFLVTGRLGDGVVDSSVLCCTAEGVLCSLYCMHTVQRVKHVMNAYIFINYKGRLMNPEVCDIDLSG